MILLYIYHDIQFYFVVIDYYIVYLKCIMYIRYLHNIFGDFNKIVIYNCFCLVYKDEYKCK